MSKRKVRPAPGRVIGPEKQYREEDYTEWEAFQDAEQAAMEAYADDLPEPPAPEPPAPKKPSRASSSSGGQSLTRPYSSLGAAVDLSSHYGYKFAHDLKTKMAALARQYLPEGEKASRVTSTELGENGRELRMSFGAHNERAGNAMLAGLQEWATDWGIKRRLLNTDGEPIPGAGEMPLTEGGLSLTQRPFQGGRNKILDPRFAAEMRAAVTQAGGTFDLNKESGITEWLVPEDSLTGEGKSLVKSLRAKLGSSNKRWQSGEATLSSLTGRTSVADDKQTAAAKVARRNRQMELDQGALKEFIEQNPDSLLAVSEALKTQKITNREEKAKQAEAERTPGTVAFKAKIFKDLKARDAHEGAVEDFIRRNPKSRLARRKRKADRARRGQKMKRFGGRAVQTARNAVMTTIGAVLAVATTGVALLAKSYQVITQIGSDVRKRARDSAQLNLSTELLDSFKLFAQHRELDPDMLARAAGGVYAAWGTPLNYNDANFNIIAPYLREHTVDLLRMATETGDANTFKIMSAVIDDLVGQTLRGVSGSKTFNPNDLEARHEGHLGNVQALTMLDKDWGDFMNRYWIDFLDSKAPSIEEWKETGKDGKTRVMDFEAWLTQYSWAQKYSPESGFKNPTNDKAADKTAELFLELKTTLGNLARDVAAALSGDLAKIIEQLRSISVNWLGKWFPIFAMKEAARAEHQNLQTFELTESLLPGYKAEAREMLAAAGYEGDLADPEINLEVRKILETLDSGGTPLLPKGIDRKVFNDAIPTLTRYYSTWDTNKDAGEELRKGSLDRDYSQRAVPGDPEILAAQAGRIALTRQHVYAERTGNPGAQTFSDDMHNSFKDYIIAIGTKMANGVIGMIDEAREVIGTHTSRLELTLQHRQEEINLHKGTPNEMLSKPLYAAQERDLHELIKAYDAAGNDEMALETMRRLWLFYKQYPSKLVSMTPAQRREANKKIEAEAENLWNGDNFANAMKIGHPEDLAKKVDERIIITQKNMAYAAIHGSRAERASVQTRTNQEIVAANFVADMEQDLNKRANTVKNPDLQSAYHWINAGGIVKIDAYDEVNKHANSDVTIIFQDKRGVDKHKARFKNTYEFTRDATLSKSTTIVADVSAAMEAMNAD